jgi:hypothetical protein
VLLVPAATEATPSEEKSQAVPASLVSFATGSNAAAVDSMGRAVAKAVTDVVGAVVNAEVSHVEHETTMAMRAATSALPLGATMIIPSSETAKVANSSATASTTAGSRARSTVLCAGGGSASTNSQGSSSKRKARDHSDGLRISSKRRNRSGGDDVNPVALQVRYSSCLPTDQPTPSRNQLSESAARVSSPNLKSALMVRVKCLGQSSELPSRGSCRTAGASTPSSPTLTSLARLSRLSHLSEAVAQGTCQCQPSESTTQASRPSPLPVSADHADCLNRLVESPAQACRQ